MSFVHGGWRDPVDEYLEHVSPSYFEGLPGRWFFSGHTHVATVCACGDKVYCNPGSVGQPRDGDARAAYAVYDHGKTTLRRVAYDVDAIAREMESAGFETYYYENLYAGTRIGGGRSDGTARRRKQENR